VLNYKQTLPNNVCNVVTQSCVVPGQSWNENLGYFKLHHVYHPSQKDGTRLSNSVWPDMEGSVFSKRCLECA